MSADEDKDSKTEEPTEKKLKDALEKGQTAVSRELPLLVSLVCFTLYFVFSAPSLVSELNYTLAGLFERVGQTEIGTALDASNFSTLISTRLVLLMAPLLLILMAGGVLSSVVQNEPRLVVNRIAPKASRISIMKGWSKLFGKQGLVEF